MKKEKFTMNKYCTKEVKAQRGMRKEKDREKGRQKTGGGQRSRGKKLREKCIY